MTPAERLAEIEARAKAATPGPWLGKLAFGVVVARDDGGEEFGIATVAHHSVLVLGHGIQSTSDHNTPFIANARTDVPYLLAQLREARELLEQAEEFLRVEMGEVRTANHIRAFLDGAK